MISELFWNFNLIFPQNNWEFFGKIYFSSANSINFAKSFKNFYQIFIITKLGKREEKKTLCS
jgi:hypothetical protein